MEFPLSNVIVAYLNHWEISSARNLSWWSRSSEASVRLLKKYLPEIGLSVPLSESDLDEASDFFDAMEFSLAVDKNEGREYDQDLLDSASNAYDDFTPIEDDDFIDMDALNARLQSAEPWSPPPAQEKMKKPGKRKSPRTD